MVRLYRRLKLVGKYELNPLPWLDFFFTAKRNPTSNGPTSIFWILRAEPQKEDALADFKLWP